MSVFIQQGSTIFRSRIQCYKATRERKPYCRILYLIVWYAIFLFYSDALRLLKLSALYKLFWHVKHAEDI